MSNEVYAPSDRLPARRLYLIMRGSAIYKGKVLGKGESFGEQDVMLTSDTITFDDPNTGERIHRERKRPQAYAITYLHVQFIGPDELEAVQPVFPKAYAAVKRVAMYRAVSECMHVYLHHHREMVKRAANAKSVAGRTSEHRYHGSSPIPLHLLLVMMKAKRKFLGLLGERRRRAPAVGRSTPGHDLSSSEISASEMRELWGTLKQSTQMISELTQRLIPAAGPLRRLTSGSPLPHIRLPPQHHQSAAGHERS